jgi:DNA-directed RNA polymerase subunit RPC12/RpoP
MALTIVQECPQCGAPIDLHETDHLIRCAYCGVNSYLYCPDHYRLLLPHHAEGNDILYAPYLRFKGTVYSCYAHRTDYRYMDMTRSGSSINGLPISLGLRPQAMKMTFVSARTTGSFLETSRKVGDLINSAANIISRASTEPILHQAFIGEALSLIYLPLYLRSNALFDAIDNTPIPEVASVEGPGIQKGSENRHPRWAITFVSAICPRCGEGLDGERDSVVLICRNCESAWEIKNGRFRSLWVCHVPAQKENSHYLPFWKISARLDGIPIPHFMNFTRTVHQLKKPDTLLVEDMGTWCPAFKIRPHVFLNLGRQVTANQVIFKKDMTLPAGHLFSATLPRQEALDAMKLFLVDGAVDKVQTLSRLEDIEVDIEKSSLVYLPFEDRTYEMVQEQLPIGINSNSLRFGRQL